MKFRNLKVIGKGTYSRVYLVENKFTGKRSAVKAFRKKYLLEYQEKGKEAIKNEINIMKRLKHPNILNLEEVHESENSIYFVLELLEGGELYEYIMNKENFSIRKILVIMRQILETIKFIHDNKIMHRDLKPENILFKKKGKMENNSLKIVDFGLATYIDVNQYIFKRCGTPGYIAPEIINSKSKVDFKYNEKCDIFSIGVIFYTLLTEQAPFTGAFNEIIKKNKACLISFEHSIFKEKSLKSLLEKMLAVDPKMRISADKALNHKVFKMVESKNNDTFLANTHNYLHKLDFKNNMNSEECSLMIREKYWNGKIDSCTKSIDSHQVSFKSMSSAKKGQIKPNSMLKLVLLSNAEKNEFCSPKLYSEDIYTQDYFDSDSKSN